MAKYSRYNSIDYLTTYSLWPDPRDTDNQNNLSWNDNGYITKELNDKSNRGWWDNVQVNNNNDMNDAYRGGQKNDFYSVAMTFWAKNITKSQYDSINNGQYDIGSSSYGVSGYVCTNYSRLLWLKYSGKWLYDVNQFPYDLYNALYSSQNYL